MREINYTVTAPNDWLSTLQKQLPSVLTGNELNLKAPAGEGSIKAINIQEGLAITVINLELATATKLNRIPLDSNDHFILNFYFSEVSIKQWIDKEEHLLGFSYYGIMLYSAMAMSASLIPANVPIHIFNITFSKTWLKQNILGEEANTDNQHALLGRDQPIYLYENLDYKCNRIVAGIANKLKNASKIELFSDVLQLLALFFKKVAERPLEKDYPSINPEDLKSLLKTKDKIEYNWQESPSNNKLAKEANMSLSKFKQLFKLIFGSSPYQYYLAFKMEKAMELLLKKEHSVSEVGYLVGYSNLGQFSKMFKKAHGLLPKEVI